jgi:hypothetical protein
VDSLWALLKWYRKTAAGKCPEATRKPLENFLRIKKTVVKCTNAHHQPIGEGAGFPSSYWKKMAISICFL